MEYLTTRDGKKINYKTINEQGKIGVILLHRLNQDMNSWNGFDAELGRQGFAVIKIDLRGHGKSEGKWQDFSETDFQKMELDAEAAIQRLGKTRNVIIGESIGANTALNTLKNNNATIAVLLSPGINYKGIISNNNTKKPVLIIASQEDEYSFQSSQKINETLKGKHEFFAVQNKGHGTQMLDEKLENKIIEWIKTNV